MSGRKPIIINWRATSPEGEVSYFRTFKDAARELGFNESSVKRAYHANRNRIGEYELEWLGVDEQAPKKTYRSIRAKVKEEYSNYLEKTSQVRLVKGRESNLCMRELGREDISDWELLELMLNALQINQKNYTLSTFPSSNRWNFEDSRKVLYQPMLIRWLSLYCMCTKTTVFVKNCCPSVCIAKVISWHAFDCPLGMFSRINDIFQ